MSVIAAAGMMFVIAADVFMRRAFESPIFGSYDIVKVLLVIIVFCAVAYVMRIREHVVVDSITRLYPKKLKKVITAISQLLSMLILVLIGWQSISYGLTLLRVGENLVLLNIPMAPFVFVAAFGYAVFFMVVLAQFMLLLAGADEDTEQIPFPTEVKNGQR